MLWAKPWNVVAFGVSVTASNLCVHMNTHLCFTIHFVIILLADKKDYKTARIHMDFLEEALQNLMGGDVELVKSFMITEWILSAWLHLQNWIINTHTWHQDILK